MANICAIDDDPAMLKLIEAFLKPEGFQVQTASSLLTARKLLTKQPFALVILDLRLADPKADGFAVLRFIRANGAMASTPVLMLTGESSPQVARSTREAGANGYLVKPIRRDWLVKRVRELLEAA